MKERNFSPKDQKNPSKTGRYLSTSINPNARELRGNILLSRHRSVGLCVTRRALLFHPTDEGRTSSAETVTPPRIAAGWEGGHLARAGRNRFLNLYRFPLPRSASEATHSDNNNDNKKSDRSKPGTKPYIISVDAYLAPKDATENSSPEKRSTAAAGRHSYLTDLYPAIHGVGPDPEKKGLNVFCQKQKAKQRNKSYHQRSNHGPSSMKFLSQSSVSQIFHRDPVIVIPARKSDPN